MSSPALIAVIGALPFPVAVAMVARVLGGRMRVARAAGLVLAWTQIGAMLLLATGSLTGGAVAAWIALGGAVLGVWRALGWRHAARPVPFDLGIIAVCALPALFLLACAAVPPWYRDELVYHLALPQQFVAAHGYVQPDDNIFANFPLGWESIVAAGMALGLPNARELGAWVTLADAAAIAGIAARFGARPAGRAAAALVFLLIPTVLEFGASAYVEPYLVLLSLLTLDAVIDATKATGPEARRWAVRAAGAWAGLAMSVKYPGVAVAGLVLTLLPGERVTALVPMLVLGTPFYLRNLLTRGNPVFPLAYGAFGGLGWDATRAWGYGLTLDHYGLGRGLVDYLLLVPRLLTTRAMHTAFQGSVGPALLVGAWALRRRPKLLLFVVAWTIWWALTVQQVRFYLPAAAVLSIGVGLQVRRRWTAGVLVAGAVAWSAAPAVNLWQTQQTGAWWTGAVSKDALLDTLLPDSAPVYRDVARLVPPNGRVWLVWMRGYTLDFPRDYRLDCVFESWRLEQALDEDAVPADVTHLLINERFFLTADSADWQTPGRTARLRAQWATWLAAGQVREVQRWGAVALYEVRP